jgi:hypothetical protein
VLSFSSDEDKYIAVQKGCAAIERGKSVSEILGIVVVPLADRMNLGDGGSTARR